MHDLFWLLLLQVGGEQERSRARAPYRLYVRLLGPGEPAGVARLPGRGWVGARQAPGVRGLR